METYFSNILTLLIFLPMAGVLFITLIPKAEEARIKWVTLIVAGIVFLLSVPMFFLFDPADPGMQFVFKATWIESWGAYYSVGVDGISLLLVLLTTFIMPLAVVASWESIHGNVKGFMISLLMLDSGMLGVFCARDMFLFYVFWEAMLIPMYVLIGIWGHEERIRAAVTFFLYTMAGSIFMLVAILYMYFQTPSVVVNGITVSEHSFAIESFYNLNLPYGTQVWLFLAYAVAFAIKVPMFPFHTWLPLAHVEAPTVGSVNLAAILLKMGPYGFIRFCIPFFPMVSHAFIPVISVLAVIGIIYGSLVAMVQPDAKKLVAYSSVAHLGFVMLGLFAMTIQGWQGGMLIMLSHGISTSCLFLMIGMLYDRRHTRLIEQFGGLWKVIPGFSVVFLVVCLSSLGLPGTNGFVGEFLALIGTFASANEYGRVYAVLASLGVILSAVYLLWMYQRVIYGDVKHEANRSLKDLSIREYVVMVPFLIFIFWIGIYPKPFISRMEASLEKNLKTYKTTLEDIEMRKQKTGWVKPAGGESSRPKVQP